MSDESRSRVGEALKIAAVAAAIFSVLALRPPVSSELRYIEAAREMVESGDWVVPHLGYVAYAEKPILTYWLGAVAQLLCGDGSVACRLPSILSGAVTALIAWLFALELRPRPFPRVAGLALMGSGMFLVSGAVFVTDPVLSACLWAAWYAFWRFDGGHGTRWIYAFWIALGLATLTKGPVAIVLCGASIALYLVIAGRCGRLRWPLPVTILGWPFLAAARQAGRMRMAAGAAIILAVNLPWWWLMWWRDHRLVSFFFVRENLQAFVDGSVNHEEPWWYYAPWLCIALAPFTLPALAALAGPVARRFALTARAAFVERIAPPLDGDADRLRLYLGAIVVPNLLFLTVCGSKLESYLLPLMPALVLLAVDALVSEGRSTSMKNQKSVGGLQGLGEHEGASRPLETKSDQRSGAYDATFGCGSAALVAARGGWRRWSVWLQATALAAAALAAAVLLPIIRAYDERLAAASTADLMVAVGACVVLGAAAVLAAVLARRERIALALQALAVGTIAALAMLSPVALDFRRDLDDRYLAEYIAPRLHDDDAVVLAHANVTDYTTVSRLRRRLAYFGPTRELGMGHWIESSASSLPSDPYEISSRNLAGNRWLWSHARLIDAWRGERRVWLLADQEVLEQLGAAGIEPPVLGRAGRRVLVCNRPPDSK